MIGVGLDLATIPILGGVGVAPYLGVVATRGYVPNQFNTAAAYRQGNSRTRHVARDTITSLQIVTANWRRVAGGNESASGADATENWSIEYPSGTFTRVKFSGLDTATVTNNTTLVSDPVAVSIPDNATFWTRLFRQHPNGLLYFNPAQDGTGTGDRVNVAASGLSDLTLGGTIPSTHFLGSMGPVAIIAQTRRGSAFLIGDSRLAGNNDNFSASIKDTGEITRSVGALAAYINAGMPSDLVSTFVANTHAKTIALAQYCSHVFTEFGINDLSNAGITAATTATNIQALRAKFPAGKPFYISTVTPYSTDAVTPRADNSKRVTYNNNLRANWAGWGFAGLLEYADVCETARDSGLWKDTYSTDWLHPTPAGCTAMQDAGLITAAMLAR